MTEQTLELDGESVPLRLRRSVQARSISLRLDPQDGAVILVLPTKATLKQGLAFAASKSDWLRERRAALPARVAFVAGSRLPLLGIEHELRPAPAARRGVWAEDGILHVSGRPEHFTRRVGDWLKAKAKAEISIRALPMAEILTAERIGRPLNRISVRDTRSRWGSCTSRGDLAFSWRLVLTPPEVLTYVVAHEVAHLAELNHSPAFWQVVDRLVPQAKSARAWLKCHGALLHRYG